MIPRGNFARRRRSARRRADRTIEAGTSPPQRAIEEAFRGGSVLSPLTTNVRVHRRFKNNYELAGIEEVSILTGEERYGGNPA